MEKRLTKGEKEFKFFNTNMRAYGPRHTLVVVYTYGCYLLDWKRDSAENGLGLAAGGRLKGLAVAAGGGRGGANIGGGNGCAEGCMGWVAGRGTGGGVGRGTDAAGDNCCPLELKDNKTKKNKKKQKMLKRIYELGRGSFINGLSTYNVKRSTSMNAHKYLDKIHTNMEYKW